MANNAILAVTGLAAICILVTNDLMAQTAVSPVFGFYRHKVPAGNSAWVSGLVGESRHAGRMDSITAGATESIVQQDNANWQTDAFADCYLEVASGEWAGLKFDIVSHTTNTITVLGNLGSGGFNLTGSETYEVREHATLAKLLPNGAGLEPLVDLVKVYRPSGTVESFTFDSNSESWVSAADFSTNADDERIDPGQGFIITAAAERTITMGLGAINCVKDTPVKVALHAGRVNLTGALNPIVAFNTSAASVGEGEERNISTLSLPAALSGDDLLELFSREGKLDVRENLKPSGGSLVDASSGANRDGAKVRSGEAIRISNPTTDKYWDAPVGPVED